MELSPSDRDCLARSLTEPQAFEPVFERHFDAVHRYLHRRAGSELADELAAETFALAPPLPTPHVAELHVVDR